ncbi:glycine/betaine ABC transporter substrate-binding protein [Clostridium aestuarii]|uniref:Glycine/betaine ABC transporter substrate-binding protein n=1 Tax=Clostridium aestuarii TaxID=338193 RepID=A0ABT4D3E4_9CLOT|nr:glycine betaine ABC transporter substrate-binding protein [Clostridium aestuarii]MCY6485652.1 glycine/betaine ABC transporter substrate-binding protein [Clostridium aestuarii]
MKSLKRIISICLIFVISLNLSSCKVLDSIGTNKNAVKVGSKNFTEQYILGEMIAQIIENEGIEVDRVFGMSGIKLIHDSIKNGAVDIYPEYTGSALMYILKKDLVKDSKKVYDIVKKEYKDKFNLIWLKQSPMDNKSVLVTTKEIATKYNIHTFSDVALNADKLVFSAPAEFWERKDGIKQLIKVYGGFNNFKDVIKMDMGMQYRALVKGQFDVTLGNSTDGQVKQYDLIILEDDKKIWPPYHVSAVVRLELLKKYPKLENKLNKLFSLLTTDIMTELNLKVDGEEEMDAEDVAREFLKKNKLLK